MTAHPFRRLSLVLATAVTLLAPAGADAAPACTRVAAPNGSDTARGTVDAPLRSAQAVIEALRPGDTGCLRAGTYDDEVNGPYVANFHRGGRRGARIALRSFPGERAKLRGVTVVSKRAGYVTISGLDIDGRRPHASDTPIGIQLMARRTVLANNDITDPTANCVGLGWPAEGPAIANVIRGNRFHDCGTTRDDMHDHAIYANYAIGGQIVENVIVRSAAYAVHLYGSNRGLRIARNVMVGNGGGVIFAGHGRDVASHNTVTHNVIADSSRAAGIQAWWDSGRGRGNRVVSNCLSGNAIDSANGGFSVLGNVITAAGILSAACRNVVRDAGVARLARSSAS